MINLEDLLNLRSHRDLELMAKIREAPFTSHSPLCFEQAPVEFSLLMTINQ